MDEILNCQTYNASSEYKNCRNCKNDYYFIKEVRNLCRDYLDLNKYYFKDGAYYPCNESIEFCDKCDNSIICTKCKNGYDVVKNNQLCVDEYFI